MESNLFKKIKECKKLAIAFSGGCDSVFLAEAAKRSIGLENTLLLLANSILLPKVEFKRAMAFAKENNFKILVENFNPLLHEEIKRNDLNRCYYCKKILFTKLLAKANSVGFNIFSDGTNIDDLEDYRPGMKASDELGVRHILLECNFSKNDIRFYSKLWGLSTWDLPAAACLASRIMVDLPLEKGDLEKIELAENILYNLNYSGTRVRKIDNDNIVLEFLEKDLQKAFANKCLIESQIGQIGFQNIIINPNGYKKGNMNRR